MRSRISLGIQLSSSPPRGKGGAIFKSPDQALLPVKKAFPPLFPRAPHLSPEPRTEAHALFPFLPPFPHLNASWELGYSLGLHVLRNEDCLFAHWMGKEEEEEGKKRK